MGNVTGLGVLRVHGGENIVGTGRGFKDMIRHRNRVSYPRYPDKKRPRYESTPDWPWATNHPASHIISCNFYRISSTISWYSPRRKLCIRLIIICPVSLYRGRERESSPLQEGLTKLLIRPYSLLYTVFNPFLLFLHRLFINKYELKFFLSKRNISLIEMLQLLIISTLNRSRTCLSFEVRSSTVPVLLVIAGNIRQYWNRWLYC